MPESLQRLLRLGRFPHKVINMKNIKRSTLTFDPFQHLMDHASAGFELDCKQACRGFKVHMAVKVFGMGRLIPNNLADEDSAWDSQFDSDDALPGMAAAAERASTAQNSLSPR